MRGLYAIVDVQTLSSRGLPPLAFAKAVLSARPVALQLRAKASPPEETLSLLRALRPLCHDAGVPLVVNDDPQLALRSGCRFVHVGQKDVDIAHVRRLDSTLAVGVSTHTLSQLDAALAARPAYVALGPIFPTSSKLDPDPVVGTGALEVARARAAAAGVPLVAIGGISLSRAATLVGLADAIAVIGALVPPPSTLETMLEEVVERARALRELFAPSDADVTPAS
jgi:thiamine-phosphate pyrophosphorylase